jgi:hypothetical protein
MLDTKLITYISFDWYNTVHTNKTSDITDVSTHDQIVREKNQ